MSGSGNGGGRQGVAVEISGLVKRYGKVEVLRGIDLAVAPGETMVIVGGSGQGKSVLLRLVAGLETPDAGEVRVGRMPLSDYLRIEPDRKPFHVAMVFQGAALLNSLTVGENVSLRLREHRMLAPEQIAARVREVLAQVELQGTENKLPGELSGGMRKRAAIARALAVEPELILYDEPTADLDPILTEQIGALMKRVQLRRGNTQIVVTHNLALAQAIADRIALLHAGRIVECLPPEQLAHSTNPLTREFLRAANVRL